MENTPSPSLKERIDSFKVLWNNLATNQKVSLGVMLFLLFSLPLGIILSLSPINFLPGMASPATPPTTPPTVTPVTPPNTPTGTPPLTPSPFTRIFEDNFDGSGILDTSRWNWSGVNGSTIVRENSQLKVSVPQGGSGGLGYSLGALPIFDPNYLLITGDFDTSVDLAGVSSTNGWQELRFSSRASFAIRRNKTNGVETLEVWTSPDNDLRNAIKNISMPLPSTGSTFRVRMIRVVDTMWAYYGNGSTYVNLFSLRIPEIAGNAFPPAIDTRNGPTNYPAVTAYFDNFYSKVTLFSGTTTPTPTIGSPTPTLAPTITRVPTTTAVPTVVDPISPTPSRSPTVTPTVAPPVGNRAPSITTGRFKAGVLGRGLEREIQATDRNGDRITMVASGLPPGLTFGGCNFRIRETGVSALNCEVAGTPSQTGIFAARFVARDVWGAETVKTIFFTILPSL